DSQVKSRRRRELLAWQRQQPQLRHSEATASAEAVGKSETLTARPVASHASNPPIRLVTFSNPARWIRLHAMALRAPPLQLTTTGLLGSRSSSILETRS